MVKHGLNKYWIELDEGCGAGYSCLTSIDDNTIGILFEGSKVQMTFKKIDAISYSANVP
jgi:sialidase-1